MAAFQYHWLRILLLGSALLVSHPPHGYAQSPSHASAELFYKGLSLFQKKQYERARYHLEACLRLHDNSLNTVEAQYYIALCAIKLGQPDGEARCHQLIKSYPQHYRAVLAYYHLGNLYFANQDFVKSIAYHSQVDTSALDKAAQHALQFRLAYAYLSVKEFGKALAYFNEIKAHKNAYSAAASYYAGYISLKKKDYATALNDLMRANENPAYQSVVPYLVLQVYYRQQRFQDLLNYIHEVRSTTLVLKEEDEIVLLMAEAYFFTKDYVAAAQHYEEYIANKDFLASSEVFYRAAYALYQAGDDYKALKYFKELALQKDVIGQSANYYAGLLYLKTNQKTSALAAFDSAQKLDFSDTIQEEATFQYAKLSYALGDFANTIGALKELQQTHATSKHFAEADTLLSEAYLRTHDYNLAIRHIEGLPQKSQPICEIYQKATFYQGSKCFNKAAYEQAICMFQKSLQHAHNQSLAVQAQLWLGESLSALQRYTQAISAYKHVLGSTALNSAISSQAVYGLGYAYFNTANYAAAIVQFVQYTKQHQAATSTTWLANARVRLADCYYATRNYQQALQSYDRAFQHYPAHVHYQKGIIYGILNDQKAARANFQAILDNYAHTVYGEKAQFEAVYIDLIQNDYPEAIKGFTKFINERPHSTLIPDALLSRAIAHVNLEQYSQAVEDYEQLLKAYAKHPNAQSALLGLSRICILQEQPEKCQQYLVHYQVVNPEGMEKIFFDIAKALFYDQYYTNAIEQLKAFMLRYPKSKLVPEAQFLVAEAYYRQDDVSTALAQYQIALQATNTQFYNKILSRMGNLAYRKKDFSNAFSYYQQLKEYARSEKEDNYALVGMMKSSYELQRYEDTQQYAIQIIEQRSTPPNHITNEVTLFLGKVAMQQGKYQEAQAHFTKVLQQTQDKYAAEAQYLLAQLHYVAQAYQQSLDVLFELNKRFSAYKEWTNRGFLLIAKNYLALNKDLQAKATLQSIINNAVEEEIIAHAQQLLKTLEQKKASTKHPDSEVGR
ncbi:MAG: tetratricopeptide repeat protein [Bacteroidota bacterium]